MPCPACQTAMPTDALFCPWCGTFVGTAATGPTQRLPGPLPARPAASRADSTSAPGCPKCQQRMIEGFLPDFDDRTGSEPSVWVMGQPERHRVTRRVTVRSDAMYAVVAYRCAGCGYLEFYAPQPAGAKS